MLTELYSVDLTMAAIDPPKPPQPGNRGFWGLLHHASCSSSSFYPLRAMPALQLPIELLAVPARPVLAVLKESHVSS